MNFDQGGWARFDIDSRLGALTISSDWGDWSHVWGGDPKTWGHPTFVEFLKDRASCHYLADKLYYGHNDRDVIDGDASKKPLRAKIVSARREQTIDKWTARHLWDAVDEVTDELDGKPWSDSVWLVLREVTEEFGDSTFDEFFPQIHEHIETEPHPRRVLLTKQILPLLISYLRGEIDADGRTTASSVSALDVDRVRSTT